ncbi:serine/threonine-protein kinase PknH/PknJ [Mycolicibacterium fallax]|uniref:non-specific serine/threonine protein kinase n=3 Tax=Mycolicibacterium fallax TaxID=1793 RepID=A0A1X1RB08_MYCFA|nr:serine/threonine-protein kinase PknH/PknJ [Mycolicibacterium fallax]ORV02457.1 hypothetical protein AWC04_12200 [Mycolicibacterium fallax]BBY97351.1 serine/threonine-protein kinase PknJ [Mycolicibacterium fallax]HOW95019.1 serine/threonine-protein kinase PknH/PknJ [Mycolicibacterium fallax]HSA40908.1 serine/threonine-protein kinase PknH/PknJ [Mycobacterium sp.]
MADNTLAQGAVFAGYRIERVLGAGGMGVVYLARNPVLPRSDALKILPVEMSRDDNFRARFVREADVAAGLTHPNIVQIYRRGEADGQLWIAMQFVDGTDAENALRAGTMTPQRAVHIVTEVAKALDHAHSRNVVHRDVKPANFLLSAEDGDAERVLLADFGIARALDDATSLTAAGSVMATVSYAAPEVLSGGVADGRTDIYALGCTLYRLLTGQAPYQGDDVAAVMMAHLQQPPPLVSATRPGLPAALDGVVATAMAKDPAQRYRTAREFAKAATAALTGGYGAERSAGPPPLTTGTTTGRYPAATGPYPGPAAPAPRRSRTRLIVTVAAVLALAAAAVVGVAATRRGGAEQPPPVASTADPAPMPDAELPGLLSSAQELSELAGVKLRTDPAVPVLASDYLQLADPRCAAAFAPGQLNEYRGSGWIASRYQAFTEIPPIKNAIGLSVFGQQIVVGFDTAGAAATFAEQQRAHWQDCSNGLIQLRSSDPAKPPMTIQVGGLTVTDDDILMLPQSLEGAQGMVCGRSLTHRNNVVVDVTLCGFDDAAEQTAQLARSIRDRIPGA